MSLTTNIPPSVNNSNIMSTCNNGINDKPEYIAFAVVMVSILVASVVGNSIVVFASYSSKQLRARATVRFIASLAMSDMLLAIIIIPVKVSETLYRRDITRFCHSFAVCYWYIFGDNFCTVAIILNLFFIAIDRFIAIQFPFKHSLALTAGRVKGIILGIWTFSAVWSVASTFKWKKQSSLSGQSRLSVVAEGEWCRNTNSLFYVISFCVIYILPLCIMAFMYFTILKIALIQIRAIESTAVHIRKRSEISNENDVSNINQRVDARKDKEKRTRKRELRATKSVAIVYFAFLACWLPSCIISIILTFDNTLLRNIYNKNKHAFYFIYYGLLQIFPALHTMINPIIYSFSNKQFRNVCYTMYRKVTVVRRKNSLNNVNNTHTDIDETVIATAS